MSPEPQYNPRHRQHNKARVLQFRTPRLHPHSVVMVACDNTAIARRSWVAKELLRHRDRTTRPRRAAVDLPRLDHRANYTVAPSAANQTWTHKRGCGGREYCRTARGWRALRGTETSPQPSSAGSTQLRLDPRKSPAILSDIRCLFLSLWFLLLGLNF